MALTAPVLSVCLFVRKIGLTAIIVLYAIVNASAQDNNEMLADTTRGLLNEVTIKGYLSEQPVLNTPSSVSVINSSQLALQPSTSFVAALNTVPGIRAEERSPGSYRLSIRGSLLRSPFGIRNIKVYYDELPFTDAGGNTYLNAIDVNSINNIEVLKGPDGSLFGANSGGVVILNPYAGADNSYVAAGVNAGSYGLFHQKSAVQQQWHNNTLTIKQAYQSYGGYRQNSYMYRHFINVANRFTYGKNELKALGYYSDLNYQTPGGLTLTQMEADPRSARPQAIAQRIGIRQKMLYGGLVNNWHISRRLKNVAAVYGSRVDFVNPFITNYEERDENTYGLRTYFEWTAVPRPNFDWQVNAGVEWQQTNALISNYDNNAGIKGDAQAIDWVNSNQHFIFTRYVATFYKRLHIEASLSLNYFSYRFKNAFPLAQKAFDTRDFKPQLMPRLAMSYKLTNNFVWRATVSRGYSTPTIAEVRTNNNMVNTALNAELGWNYETGFRLRNSDESTFLDFSVFYYRLQSAIVRRLQDETEYYINSGSIKQPGAEVYFSSWLYRQGAGLFKAVQFNTAYTLSRYTFENYTAGATDYSGNKLTGVPGHVLVSSVQVLLPLGFAVFIQHNFTDRIPLNDANTYYASKYHLLQARATWRQLIGKARLEIYAGADNLLNQRYSLGNDLNAFGNRYYNPAALRNYNVGINVVL
ncbi:TonB-dependent receptor [Mucilaginibacter hurinus]|uniref:TonB-dependent receptor n=1 Tax=Mucilaginibacter hurinus TaxID=2201324 RepID=A0A367GPE3_9SPHI|nr:TonB-dependent receptor [Mucilaginibacter hurinus]RCH54948.1 TonB-dependent receptor [Mucilaginibacter hurinus]